MASASGWLTDLYSPADMAEWARHAKQEVDRWRIAIFVLSFLAVVFVGYAAWGLRGVPQNWSTLVPYFVSRAVLGIPLLIAMRIAQRKHGNAAALLAAGLFGDARTISSAIAAQGAYTRNLVLRPYQTTEHIAGCRATFESRKRAKEKSTPRGPNP